MDKQEPVAKFKVGDPVQRAEPRSYLFPGIVIGANLKLDGKTWLYSVECIAPGVEGMVHEFTERALEARANRPADDGLEAATLSPLANAAYAIASLVTGEDWSLDVVKASVVIQQYGEACVATALRAQSDAEVERIVAWLEDQAKGMAKAGDIGGGAKILLAAQAIERGEHRKDGV